MPFEVLLFFAFVGGLLAFISPCILPMVPIYLAYMSGSSASGSVGGSKSLLHHTMVRTGAFILGFTVVFVVFSVVFYVLFSSLAFVQQWIQRLAGVFIVVMGLHFLGVFRLGFLDQEVRLNVEKTKTKPVGSFLLGVSFAAGWSPCIGPILSAILFSAATTQNLGLMVILLLLFSAGVGLPFLLAGVFVSSALGWVRSMKRFFPVMEKVSGVFLIVLGGLLIFNTMGVVAQWLLQVFPQLGMLETQLMK